jgi:hypothetical protein
VYADECNWFAKFRATALWAAKIAYSLCYSF